MSDQSALAAAREEAEEREQGTEQTLAPDLSQVERDKVEQKETKETKSEGGGGGEQGVESPDTLIPALSQGEREKTAERIRQSEALPVGLRTRLAELVLASDSAAAEQAIRAVEASLPGALRVTTGEMARPAHPAGDVFFHGDADAVSAE